MKLTQRQLPMATAFVPASSGPNRSEGNFQRNARGVALVLVLAFIALCTVLVVAFFASVSTEAVSERAASSENSAAQLAASAVQLVEGTISYATEPKADTTYAWACQPGMIRTYGSQGGGPGATSQGMASSNPLAYFKLYSSDNMILNGMNACNNFTTSNTDVPQHWDFAPSLYTDLNAPLLKQVSSGATTTTSVIFPIVDPRAQDLTVEGFSYTPYLNGSSTTALDGVTGLNGTYAKDSATRLAMPVRWMYVLKDGTMTVPDGPTVPASGTASTATWSGATSAPAPSSANPIVGRVAFWTDDESAKVNINTASEGTYQDTPVANSGSSSDKFTYPQTTALGDYVLAQYPGVQHEYQRYPGHPATTCLSSVFNSALSGSRNTVVQNITNVIPRITDYAVATGNSGASTMGGTQAGATTTPILTTDFDRLYASLDEFQFNPARATPNLQTSGTAQTNSEQNLVDSCRFFITAHSKAPELNMFGLPRVAMWPLWDTALVPQAKLTPFDQEILRCSTVTNGLSSSGGVPHSFAFFRANPLSATVDFPTSGSPTTGIGVQRNHQVFGYLQNLLARPVPGFGNSFASKYNGAPLGPQDSDQILTEIFDYIRSTNLADNSSVTTGTTTTTAVPYTGTYGNGNVGATSIVPPAGQNASPGQVVPIQIPVSGGTAQGFGRIATIGEMLLVLTKVDDRNNTSAAPGGTNYAKSIAISGPGAGSLNGVNVSPATQTLVEWCLIPKIVSPMCGYVGLANDVRLVFSNSATGGTPLMIGTTTVDLSTAPNVYDTGRLSCNERDSVIGGNIGVESLVECGYQGSAGSPPDSMYPTGLCLVTGGSQNMPPSPAPTITTMPISGSFTVKLYAPAGGSANGTPLQTYTFTIPTGTTVPIPQVPVSGTSWYGTFRTVGQTAGATGGTPPPSAYQVQSGSGTASATAIYTYPLSTTTASINKGYIGRFNPAYRTYIGVTDVVRSLVATGPVSAGGTTNVLGDIRVVASSPTPPTSVWQLALTGAGTAATSTTYAADSAEMGTLGGVPGNARGQLAAKISNSKYQYAPEVPPLPNGNVLAVTMPGSYPGDWDNAPGLMTDGPWVNKPDEGTSATGSLPYIGNYESMVMNGAPLTTQFSPNRQISSPVMFGSLLTGADHPWRTLLFRPATLPGYQGGYTHPGNSNPATFVPDHLLLDLFWMPIVEPYGISEPLATSGKINLNTQIMPFTYINRTTGMNAVLKSVMITALNPDGTGATSNGSFSFVGTTSSYKWGPASFPTVTTRYPVDAKQTLAQITGSADATSAYPEFSRTVHTVALPNFFVSASQICDVPLIPTISSAAGLSGFWGANSLTGDNSLERPYSYIYPRVTTKSNIFTVHVIAQSLKQIPADAAQGTWYENKDQVLSEYRGAFTVEKYFDPNTDDLTDSNGNTLQAQNDGTTNATANTAAGLRATKWRLLGVKRFGQ